MKKKYTAFKSTCKLWSGVKKQWNDLWQQSWAGAWGGKGLGGAGIMQCPQVEQNEFEVLYESIRRHDILNNLSTLRMEVTS